MNKVLIIQDWKYDYIVAVFLTDDLKKSSQIAELVFKVKEDDDEWAHAYFDIANDKREFDWKYAFIQECKRQHVSVEEIDWELITN